MHADYLGKDGVKVPSAMLRKKKRKRRGEKVRGYQTGDVKQNFVDI